MFHDTLGAVMGWKQLAVAVVAVGMVAGAGLRAEPQEAPAAPSAQSPTMDPDQCTKLEGFDAQMACLQAALQGLKDMSANAEPIIELPPDEPRIVGDPASGACHVRGQSQPVWPSGELMGPTAHIDECVSNHGAVVADFVELCEAGFAIARQAGPNNLVLRYLKACPANPKSMCSMEPLPREGADPDDREYLRGAEQEHAAADSRRPPRGLGTLAARGDHGGRWRRRSGRWARGAPGPP